MSATEVSDPRLEIKQAKLYLPQDESDPNPKGFLHRDDEIIELPKVERRLALEILTNSCCGD